MALFKISKGNSANLASQKANEGFAYFTPDDGKFYIDIEGEGTETAVLGTNRIVLNAAKADVLKTARYIDGLKFDGSADVHRYATCSTAAATVAKVASAGDGEFKLATGARVTVKFSNANTAANPTLNVDSTGAKAIYWHGAALASSQYWQAGAVLDFVYNGTQWELIGIAKDNNTTYGTATTGTAGLMSAADKEKLDGIASGANAYTLPTASTTLGGVKTTSNVTSTSDLTACPIIGGIVYYKDTNTHAVSSVFGRTGAVTLTKSDVTTALGYTPPTTNTTYSAGTGITLSGTTFSNSGVRSIASGNTNGTISVNTNGTSTDVAVKGLGSNAYTSTAYLPLAGGTITGALTVDNGNSSGKVELSEDGEGGTIKLFSKSGTYCYEMDAYNDETIRIHTATLNPNGTVKIITWNGKTGALTADSVYGAVWNDYAEYRKTTEEIEAGHVVIENGDDTLSLATERLMPGANVVSDTFGFAIGETETSKTPLAVSGRALVYTYEDRNSYKPGDPVCSGPNGTVSKMTREEVMAYPDRMIGTVSAIPDYDTWGTGNVKINNRIWIKIL